MLGCYFKCPGISVPERKTGPSVDFLLPRLASPLVMSVADMRCALPLLAFLPPARPLSLWRRPYHQDRHAQGFHHWEAQGLLLSGIFHCRSSASCCDDDERVHAGRKVRVGAPRRGASASRRERDGVSERVSVRGVWEEVSEGVIE